MVCQMRSWWVERDWGLWIAGGRDGVDREGSIVDRDDQGCGRGATVWNGNQGAWIPHDRVMMANGVSDSVMQSLHEVVRVPAKRASWEMRARQVSVDDV